MARFPLFSHKNEPQAATWLIAGALIFVALSFLLNVSGPFLNGRLGDPDDYMRFTQVFGWLDGQSWYDLSQPRMDPGSHFVMDWSRIVDLPIAALLTIFEPLMGRLNAALAVSFILPLFFLAALLLLMPSVARPLVPRGHAFLTTIFILCSIPLLGPFSPGRVDHHHWQLLIAAAELALIVRLAFFPSPRAALAAGLLGALGLCIGAESLPWLMLTAAILALFSAANGNEWNRAGTIYALALFIGTALGLLLLRAPNDWTSVSFQRISLAHVVFAGLNASLFILLALAGRVAAKPVTRLAALILFGLCAAIAFYFAFPAARHGIYADFSPVVGDIVLNNVIEAKSWLERIGGAELTWKSLLEYMPLYGKHLFAPLLAWITVLVMAYRTKGMRRTIWLIHAVYLTAAFGLMLFWQSRVATYAHLFSIVPLTYLLHRGLVFIAAHYRDRRRFAAEATLFLALGPFMPVLLPALTSSGTLLTDTLLYPAARAQRSCDLKDAANFLSRPSGWGNKPVTIISTLNEGPELLFRTPHSVLAAPYDVRGSYDSYEFFTAKDDRAAREVLKNKNISLILVCKYFAPLYRGDNNSSYAELTARSLVRNNKPVPDSIQKRRVLIARLTNEETPEWLEKIRLPGQSAYLLYAVKDKTP